MSSESIIDRFAPLITPKTVAVVGASSKGKALPNAFIRRIREFGYDGAIYPIHPTAAEIEGLPAYRRFADMPASVDYAFIAIPAAEIPELLSTAGGRVRYAQVISSGFGESSDGSKLQERLVAAAQAGGMRLLGPNCLGLYTPRGRITFTEICPRELGTVGVVSQSGGLGTDIVRRGMIRGIRFSGVVSVGNCADIGASDLLEFYLADPQTRVIGLYVETARDGRRLFEMLRAAQARKPVVILKGGRSRRGAAAAVSHTGALAGDYRAWVALARQTGSILVNTLESFLDALSIFQTITPRTETPTRRVVLFGNGGGASVLATDYFEELGLHVEPFDKQTIEALAALKLPAGSCITNPVDCGAVSLQRDDGRVAESILDAIYKVGNPEALVMHLNMTSFSGITKPEVLENIVQAALRVQRQFASEAHFVLVLRSDGEPELESRKHEFRTRAVKLGIPVFDEITNAGHALAAMRKHEQFVQSRRAA
ncbi:MAG: CoA-binding protein [Betaproteobacteria bacterium]|nr:CoA-binding protein [Betaproteobacteria bacterium]